MVQTWLRISQKLIQLIHKKTTIAKDLDVPGVNPLSYGSRRQETLDLKELNSGIVIFSEK